MAHIVASSQHCLPQQPGQALAPLPTSPAKAPLRTAVAGAHNPNSAGARNMGSQEGDMLEAHRDAGKGPLGDRHKFIKFKLEKRGVRKSSKDAEEPVQFHKGGGEVGRQFLDVPMDLCDRTLKIVHPSDKTVRTGKVLSWNSQKKEHRITLAGGETLDVDLTTSDWLLCNEAAAGREATTREANGNAAQGDTPHTTNYSSDKTDRELDFDGVGSGKGSRKRPANMALDDQFGLPQLSHGIGLIPPKGRRPYRQGGCKAGRYMKTEDLVGRRVHMWSSKDSVYVAAGVAEYDRSQGLHKVIYLDDTSEWINMESAIWRLGTSEHDFLYPEHFDRDVLGQDGTRDQLLSFDGQRDIAAAGLVALAGADRGTAVAADANDGMGADEAPRTTDMGPEVGKKLVASSMEFQVHKVNTPNSGYHVLCSVPPGTKIGDVHVTCGNACIIIEHGKNKKQE
ncbi:unnamed protein product, partial [Ostreobium quekettii]